MKLLILFTALSASLRTLLATEKPDLAQRLAASGEELKPPVFPGSSVKNEGWGWRRPVRS